ncbi:Tetratricopeptide TPR_2 repeat protein [Desulfatibacillum aliphaticivorans]|uniref:Tetratricopeptide TPR_2 repeat protein n=1 Tax=Desulfatibacillum aliphaticivorans TaxID=218208 RepID=B8FEQ1_DESAL|nr:glycosyltransferase family 39 protein [Desulfatibacillum aliphaticivorans]ACL03578.1 Tetratricopeptide TPR_2 repeat protein [Desulfatibacillum aliphaticivorans]
MALLGAVFATAFLVRLFYCLEISRTPLFSLLMNDAASYDAWAREIAGGDWLGDKVFYQAPLYPYFLGAVYRIFGPDLFTVRLIQAAIGSITCVLTAAAGKRYFSLNAGAVAGFLMALYPPAVYFDVLIQKTVLALFFTALFLYIAGKGKDAPSGFVWLASGVCLGLLCLVRENALLLVFPAGLWIFWGYGDQSRRKRASWALAFFLGTALILMPVGIRNQVVGGRFFITTSQFGPNFYIGANPEANGMYMPLVEGRGMTEFEREDATRLAQEAEGRELTPAQVSRYWTGKALDFILSSPGHWAALMLQKSWLFWNATELPDTECQYTYEKHSRILGAIAENFHFGILLPLAVFGVCSAIRDRKSLGLLYVSAAGFFASTILFYVFARYRAPIIPILAIFAGAGLAGAAPMLMAWRIKQLALCLASALVIALLVNQPLPFKNQMTSMAFYNAGTTLYNQGRENVSIPYFREAIRLDPEFAFAHYNLALALERLGRNSEALVQYTQAVRLNPDADRHRIRLDMLRKKMNGADD